MLLKISLYIVALCDGRAGLTEVKGVVNPFDWTYTTDYKGSLFSEGHHELDVRPWSVDTTVFSHFW